MDMVQALQGGTPSSLEAEEARLSAYKGGMAAVDGSFDLILADLKSECFLPMCSEDPEGKDPAVGENGGGAAPSLDEAMGEGGGYLIWPCMAMFMFWDWPLVALNPFRSADFYEWMISLRLNVRARPRFTFGCRGAMTNSTYVSRNSVDLIPYRFEVLDSNELGGRLYRLDLREEYVFGKMLMRMIVPFFFETRISSMRCLVGNSFLGVFAMSRNAKG
ncbi:hypothetical protein F2Q69_00023195 [Brassica cretica]|uniref:Uncharacterized protein n=1 Tax=Brassica cretica TaxID=69181 RepID=A0A8S9QKI7_BRACR|nr:hypothetical protein F2Q69_00023195 [Brassica cretica]